MRNNRLVVAAGAAATSIVLVTLLGIPGSARGPSVTAAGATVAGLPAGGLDRSGLTALLSEALAQQPPRLVVKLGTRQVTLPAVDVGMSVDVPATVERALAATPPTRRRGGAATRPGTVPAVLSIDAAALDRTVNALAVRAAVPADHGDLRYDHGEITALAPRPGQSSSPQQIRTALLSMAGRLPWPRAVEMPVRAVPSPLSPADLEPPLRRAQQLLQQRPVLIAGARRVTVNPDLLGPALTVAAHDLGGVRRVDLALRATAGTTLATPLATQLSTSPTEPQLSAPSPQPALREQGTVSWRPRPVTVTLTAPGKPGQQVSARTVLAAISTLLPARAPDIARIPPARTVPASTDAQAQTVDAVLGTFTTPFSCCQPRVRNITLIARAVDGTLVGPGQTFSLNDVVGPRTRAKGYVPAPFILDGELSTDIGGGVSQFATTLLNATYFAGLRIDTHQPHSFYIGRYPPGREATVNYPTIDLKWTNTSGAPVLVRAATRNTSLTVTLYGRDDGRSVRSTTGPRTPVAGKDFRITVTRETAIPGQPVTRESWTTTYSRPPANE